MGSAGARPSGAGRSVRDGAHRCASPADRARGLRACIMLSALERFDQVRVVRQGDDIARPCGTSRPSGVRRRGRRLSIRAARSGIVRHGGRPASRRPSCVLADDARQGAVFVRIGLGEGAAALVDDAPGAALAVFLPQRDRLARVGDDGDLVGPQAMDASRPRRRASRRVVLNRVGVGRQDVARATWTPAASRVFCSTSGSSAPTDVDVAGDRQSRRRRHDHVEAVVDASCRTGRSEPPIQRASVSIAAPQMMVPSA